MSDSITSVNKASAAYQVPQIENPKNTLGKDAFLKLLVTQMTHQDPLEPISNENMILQLAQMSSFEAMDNLSKQFSVNAGLTGLMTASGMIGRQVSYNGADGQPKSGVIEKVQMGKGEFVLLVNGEQVKLGDITSIEPAPAQGQQAGAEAEAPNAERG